MSKQVYDEQIAPLMKQIYDLCVKHDIPMHAIVQIGEDEEAFHFAATLVSDVNRKIAPEVIACGMISEKPQSLALSVIAAVHRHDANAHPHGIAH